MATLPRPSVVHVAEGGRARKRVTIALAQLAETAREGLLALSFEVGLAVVGEIFEEEITKVVEARAASTVGSGRPTAMATSAGS